MKVAVINITNGGISGGYRKYLSNIIPRMAQHPEIEAMLCVYPKAFDIESWLAPVANVEFSGCLASGWMRRNYDAVLEAKLEKFSPDVIFIPTERYFGFKKIPVVNMVQNMEPLIGFNQGNPLAERFKNRLRAYCAKQAIKKSIRVIAISGFVKDYLVRRLGVLKEKIGLVYYGIDHPENRALTKPSIMPVEWKEEFIFTAGSVRPARGLEDIFWAMYYLKSQNDKLMRLVIAGNTTVNLAAYQDKLKTLSKKLGIFDQILWVNYLNDQEMGWCYQNCRLFIMSSRVESFGQIGLEAMSYGCVCIYADNPCLPEIFKDTAIGYIPKDGQSLAKKIKSVLNLKPTEKEELAVRARNRATEFSWEVCARKTVAELVKAKEFNCRIVEQ